MKLRFMKNPDSDKPDLLVTLSFVGGMAATIRFLLDGVTVSSINFGHIDATVYAAFLGPILAAHGYANTTKKPPKESSFKPDNPDT